MRYSWIWTVVLLVTVLAVLLVAFAFPASALRPAVLMWFLLFCPGIALLRILDLTSHPVVATTLAIGMSIALDGVFASVLMYMGTWSPYLILMVMVWFTLACVLVQLLLVVFREGSIQSLDDLDMTLPQTPALPGR